MRTGLRRGSDFGKWCFRSSAVRTSYVVRQKNAKEKKLMQESVEKKNENARYQFVVVCSRLSCRFVSILCMCTCRRSFSIFCSQKVGV